jgi:hypothetical protein
MPMESASPCGHQGDAFLSSFCKVMLSYLASFVPPQSVATCCNLLLNHCMSC